MTICQMGDKLQSITFTLSFFRAAFSAAAQQLHVTSEFGNNGGPRAIPGLGGPQNYYG